MPNRSVYIILSIWLLATGCSSPEPTGQFGKLIPGNERFTEVVPEGTVVDRIGIRFEFTEGPAWHPDDYLIFSDIPANTIYRWEGRKFGIFRQPSGNANGLLVLSNGTLIACEHGTRTVSRYTQTGEREVLADSYRGRRLNSPNDLCRTTEGVIYFTDPPYGLSQRNLDPSKELLFNGVYRLYRDTLTLIDSTLSWPNGIALSPDERYLYVANTETEEVNGATNYFMQWLRYTLGEDGDALQKEVFFTPPDPSLPGGPDGMKVDSDGNLFLTGPGGILVADPAGEYLGTISFPDPPSNLTFGPREETIYVTARSAVYRVIMEN